MQPPTLYEFIRKLSPSAQDEIAAKLRRMGNDNDYQREAREIDRQFAESDAKPVNGN